MKVIPIAPAGLVLAAILSFSSTGCRIHHSSIAAPRPDAGEEAVCKATCDRLIDQQALSSTSAKVCLSACRSGAPSAPAKAAEPEGEDARAQGDSPAPPDAQARAPRGARRGSERRAEARRTEEPRAAPGDPPAEETCCPRAQATCPCASSHRPAHAHAGKHAPSPARACQTDWDCPEEMECDSGACR